MKKNRINLKRLYHKMLKSLKLLRKLKIRRLRNRCKINPNQKLNSLSFRKVKQACSRICNFRAVLRQQYNQTQAHQKYPLNTVEHLVIQKIKAMLSKPNLNDTYTTKTVPNRISWERMRETRVSLLTKYR